MIVNISMLLCRKKFSNRILVRFACRFNSTLEPEEEKIVIHQNPLLHKKTNVKTTKQSEYLTKKYDAVSEHFPKDENGLLMPHLSSTPYHTAQEPYTPRLSVTKMLTKSWCEVRHAFDAYSQMPIYETKRIKKGKEEHKALEDEAHPMRDLTEMKATLKVPKDEFHVFVEAWYGNVLRLVALFMNSEAREILAHGYINADTCELLRDDVLSDRDILISGVIDRLFLTTDSTMTADLEYYSRDIKSFVEVLPEVIAGTKGLQLVTSDVKTRAIKTVPQYPTVIEAAKIQVMYYRYFLEYLSTNGPEFTYDKMLINAVRRGYDVDQPIDPMKLVQLMEMDPIINKDMERLRDGEAIGFEDFDNYIPEEAYDLSDVRVPEGALENNYGHLWTKWQKPLTLRYFAARMAQLYSNLAPFLSEKLQVEYHCRGYPFATIQFDYDAIKLHKESVNSGLFWFGHRDIEPFAPTKKNFETYCGRCDYKNICEYFAANSADEAKLGPELQKIQDES